MTEHTLSRTETSPSPVTVPIPLVDLKAQYAGIADEISKAIQGSVERCDFVLGSALREFERDFADYCGTDHAIGVASGTDALHIACRAAGIGPGDEVIVPAFTFIATALGVSLTGATPVLVDVNPADALMDSESIEAAITPRTRAIIPVHIFGQCADVDAIRAIARRHELVIVEDAAQAHGAGLAGRRAGSLGDMGCFSFYPGKNLGAYGDGGAVTTSDPKLADRLRSLRNLGSLEKHHHAEIGLNSRLDTLQAAVLGVKLRHLERWNEARRRIAGSYDEFLKSRPDITVASKRCIDEHVFHLYVILCEDRDARLARLNAAGIGAGIHYPRALHQHPAYQHLGHTEGDFPGAERVAATCLSLPIYPELGEGEFQRIIDHL